VDGLAAVVAQPGLGDPDVALAAELAGLEVEPGRVAPAPALDVGLPAKRSPDWGNSSTASSW
jgi:hypothetical protein